MPSSTFSGDGAAPLPRRALFLALCAACAPVPALAATTVWDGSDGGLWTSGPWIDTVPAAGDDVLLLAPAGSFTGSQTVIYDETGAPVLGSLTIDGTATDSMTLDHGANTLHTNTLTIGSGGTGHYALSGTGALTIDADFVLADDGIATVTQTAGSAGVGGNLLLGNGGLGSGTYTLSGGSLTVTGTSSVGAGGTGSFVQTNADGDSTHTTGTLVLGAVAGSTGSYALTDTASGFALSLDVAGDTIVGGDGTGTFTQDGGAVTSNALYLGGGPNPPYTSIAANGTYTLSAGTLTTNATNVGNNGSGIFQQSGGTFHAGVLLLGNAGSSGGNSLGQFFLSGTGTLISSQATIGAFGRGEFTQSGGTHTVGADLVLGDGPATGGTPVRGGFYTLSGGSLGVVGSTILGNGNNGFTGEPGGDGTFTQSGGTHTVGGDLIVGNTGTLAGGTGSYALSGTGALVVTGALRIGAGLSFFGGSGSFTQTGGSAGAAALRLGEAGLNTNGTGTYVLSGGTLTIVGDSTVGAGGSATLTQSGGTYTTGNLIVDGGSYGLSAGTASVGSTLRIGTGAFASLTQSGGSLDVAGQGFIGAGAGGNGTYTLTGGSLAADYIDVAIVANSTGLLRIRGGTATARVNLVVGVDDGTHGTVNQSGGTVLVQSPDFGLYVNNSYQLASVDGPAVLAVTHDELIGDTGNGSFVQSSGTHTVGHTLYIGANSDGSLTLVGGSLGVTGDTVIGLAGNVEGALVQYDGSVTVGGRLIVGEASSNANNRFFQQGGTVAVTGDLIIGNLAGSTGLYSIVGGSLSVHGSGSDSRIVVGGVGTGDFQMTTGTSVSADGLSVGNNPGGSGTFTLSGGTLTITSSGDFGRSVIGALGTGTFVQDGGTHTTTQLSIGNNPGGGNGSYVLNGGLLQVGGASYVGAASTGDFTQTGGTHQAGTLAVGLLAGSTGRYVQQAGIVRVTGNATIGAAGSGTYTQTGGLLLVGGNLLIGAEAGSTGKYALNNATLAVGGTIVLGGTTTANGGSGELALSGTANLYANGLDLRPGGTLTGLGGGITLGDSEQGNAEPGTILVNRGGTLAGNGTIPGSVTVGDGGTVSPGNSIGTLTVGDIVFGSGSTLRIEIDGAGNADLLHASGTVTIDGGTLRIDSVDGSYAAGAHYTVLLADGGVSGTFPNVVTSLPLLAQTATYTANAVTLVVPTPDQNASRSGVDLIGGSPASLLGRMTLGDVEAGFLLDPLLAGIEEGQAGIGLRVGRYYTNGYRQTYEELPLRYAWKLDNGLTVLGELPIATITTSGRGVNRQDRSYGLGGGLRIPMATGWELKPMLRYGTVVDDNFDHIGSLASATLTSHFRTGFGNGYEFGADNLIGYFKSVGGNVVGLDARYRLHEVALHNAVRVGGPLEGTFLGSGARWTAWISDTRYLGSDLANDNFQRIGVAATTRVSTGGRFSENLSLGLNYTQSAGGDHGVELNFGYRF